MKTQIFDIGVIGSGPAGIFGICKLLTEKQATNIILFEAGRPPQKRRHQCQGFLGFLPTGNGQLYVNDLQTIENISTSKKSKSANTWFMNYMSDVMSLDLIKDTKPSVAAEKRIKKSGFSITTNNHFQIYPKDVHVLSKTISSLLDNSRNITTKFDTDVEQVVKHKNYFSVITSSGEYQCKKVIICVGRSGWRWATELYKSFGIIKENDYAQFGIRVEVMEENLSEYNKSNCSIHNDDLIIGPLSWNGTVIPEDHVSMSVSAFRSNEERWKSDKVSFNLIGNRLFNNNGFEQADRIGQLTFLLGNDRIFKERISSLFAKKSKTSLMREYNWLTDAVTTVSKFIPDIISKGYFYAPTLLPMVPSINVSKDFETDIKGLYVAGECARVPGILGAAVSGIIACEAACNK